MIVERGMHSLWVFRVDMRVTVIREGRGGGVVGE